MAQQEYKPIAAWPGLGWPDNALSLLIADIREHLGPNEWQELRLRVDREWAIESGQIEGAYDIGLGQTIVLIEQGFVPDYINKQPNGLTREAVAAILTDMKEALDGIYAFLKQPQPLSTSYIRQLHQALLRSVDTYTGYVIDPETSQRRPVPLPLPKGEYKKQPNNPSRDGQAVHVYCPPEFTVDEMEQLVAIYARLELHTSPIHLSAWLHHAFTVIHPFLDGNGRVARALASLVLLKANLLPFTVHRNMRTAYIQALEQADQGNHAPLIEFFESCLYRKAVDLLGACRFAVSTIDPTLPLPELSAQIAANLRAKQQKGPQSWDRAAQIRNRLQSFAMTYLGQQISVLPSQFAGSITSAYEVPSHLVSVNTLESWTLDLQSQNLTSLVLSNSNTFFTFEPIHANREGISAVTATIKLGERFERLTAPFFFHFHTQDPESAFQAWLDRALKAALLRWFGLQR